MPLTLLDKTAIGLGHAPMDDAFQGGREAAQMAKAQLPEGTPTLLIGFGPATATFREFSEGVRLIGGETPSLICPVRCVFSSESRIARDGLVVAARSTAFSSRSATGLREMPTLAATTHILTRLRQQRAAPSKSFPHRGLFWSGQKPAGDPLASHIEFLSAETGPAWWTLGAFSDATLAEPLTGLEILSEKPWGLSSLSLDRFQGTSPLMTEAATSAVRSAIASLNGLSAALVFLFFYGFDSSHDPAIASAVTHASGLLPYAPLIGCPLTSGFVRLAHRSLSFDQQAIVAWAVPQ